MKIVVLDGYTLNPGDLAWEGLENMGDLTLYDRTTYDLKEEKLIIERVGDAEIVFTNKTPLSKSALEKMPNLKYIGVLATGYNVVDIEAAKERGVVVTNIPTYGTDAVAQMTFALLLEMCQHVGVHSKAVLEGRWSRNVDFCFWDHPLMELSGKTMGIIGFGRIGQAVGKIAHAFNMKVLAYDYHGDKMKENEDVKFVTLEELLSDSDVISLHCPLLESTKGIINIESIGKMKRGVLLINTSRGPLIVEEDLAEALNEGRVGGAALDVVSKEPIEEDNPLLKAKNIIITPHIAWAPVEARQRLMEIAVNNLKQYLKGQPTNVVNP